MPTSSAPIDHAARRDGATATDGPSCDATRSSSCRRCIGGTAGVPARRTGATRPSLAALAASTQGSVCGGVVVWGVRVGRAASLRPPPLEPREPELVPVLRGPHALIDPPDTAGVDVGIVAVVPRMNDDVIALRDSSTVAHEASFRTLWICFCCPRRRLPCPMSPLKGGGTLGQRGSVPEKWGRGTGWWDTWDKPSLGALNPSADFRLADSQFLRYVPDC